MAKSFRLTNPHSILEALEKRPKAVKSISISGDANKLGQAWQKIERTSSKLNIPNRPNRSSSGSGRKQASAEVEAPEPAQIEVLYGMNEENQVVLALDCVQDPQNLGAIMRTAAFFGVSAVVIPSDRAAQMSELVMDIASGGAEHVPLIAAKNLARALDQLKDKGFWVMGTSEHAKETLGDEDLSGKWVLVMGGEESGLRRLVEEKCDRMVKFAPRGGVQSLNVSAATVLALSHF